MKVKLVGILIAAGIIAAASIIAMESNASAQGQPPEIKILIFQGNVTVAGQPAPDGMAVTARIGGNYVSAPAFTGAASPGRYVGLVAAYEPDKNTLGQTIQFWLDDQVLANETNVLAPLLSNGQPCPFCDWILPLSRTLDLTFNTMPVATATPTVTPTPTVVFIQPSFYGGRVIAGASVPPDGYEIVARIGDYTSEPGQIQDGRFQLVVNPQQESMVGALVQFFIGNAQAIQTIEFQQGVFNDNLNLVFAGTLPTPTPTVTPTPSATPTPEPSRTATPTPSPSPTVTPTVTPTMTAGEMATATALAGGGTGGGMCSANAGGPASIGMIGLLIAPLGLLAMRRLRKARSAVHEA